MSIVSGVSLEEYLHKEYEPDCDYVDGVLEDRNVGKQDHSETQAAVASFFGALKKRLRIRICTELRMQVSATRVRVPDVAIVPFEDRVQVKQRPPLLCIGVVSPDDRLSRLVKVVADYIAFGVPMVWVIDPQYREAFVATQENPAWRQVDKLCWNDVVLELADVLPE